MKARVEQVDLDKIKPDVNNGYGFVKWPSGYDIHFVSRASYLDSNPKNSHTYLSGSTGVYAVVVTKSGSDHKEKSQILIVMQLKAEYITQNEGEGGHVAVLNTFAQSSVGDKTMFSMTFGDPSPQRFLYNYNTMSPYKLPDEINSWMFYKIKIINYNKP